MLHTFIRKGRSFSGRERNCCFLNLGPNVRRHADISSISGLDFPDDGRALARVDWDHDGDLDFWVANRSGPQVRFLRNDAPGDHHHLSVRLVGRDCNRDAIGARVELVLKGSPGTRLSRTVQAGDGFLAQSSKWIHFGLGASKQIERLDVRWPGGRLEEIEEIRGLEADRRYVIEQGKGLAGASPVPRRDVRLEALEASPAPQPSPPESSGRMRIVSAARLPVPALRYQTFDGQTFPVVPETETASRGAPTLVILWASWCQPCLVELREISSHSAALIEAGLDVVALSIDFLGEEPHATARELEVLLGEFGFPYRAGLAYDPTVTTLEMFPDRLFDLHRPFPVPISFLIGTGGELTVIYRGRVDLQQLVSDVRKVKGTGEALRSESLPFAGRWLRAPKRISPFALAWDLLEKGHAEEGLEYLETHRKLLETHIRFPRLAVLAGNARLARGEAASAIALYREALSLDSDYFDAQNNLAWVLATHADARFRNGEEAVRLAEAALRKTNGADPSVWSTASVAYAEVGQFDRAIAAARKAIALARSSGQTQLGDNIARRLALFENGQPYREE